MLSNKEVHFRSKGTHRLRVIEWIKLHHANGVKKMRDTYITSGEIDFKLKAVTRERKDQFIRVICVVACDRISFLF